MKEEGEEEKKEENEGRGGGWHLTHEAKLLNEDPKP